MKRGIVKKNYTPEDELLFLSLGGSGEIGMNVNLYGCQGRWLMVDLGMTFSGEQYPGVDLVFADFIETGNVHNDLLNAFVDRLSNSWFYVFFDFVDHERTHWRGYFKIKSVF